MTNDKPQMELPQLPIPPMTITQLMNACCELAGALQALHLVAFDWPYQDTLKIIYDMAHVTSKGSVNVFHRELERERHYSNLDHINDMLTDIGKLKADAKHNVSAEYVQTLNAVVAQQADQIEILQRRVTALEKIGKKVK